jgi:hypothetical protein
VVLMLSLLRRRLCYANVVATLALVFAMSGGALAAGHYLLTSTSQVSPKVLKALKGKAGQTGPAGAQGSQGVQGTVGPSGAQGPAGETGPAGVQGPAGEAGAAGKEGSPWTAGGTLPAGKSETGAWSASGGAEDAASATGAVLASFAIPLPTPPTVYAIGIEEGLGEPKENERVRKENEERKAKGEPELPLTIPADCKGNFKKPEAVAGNLCVFVQHVNNVNVKTLAEPSGNHVTSTAGVIVYINPSVNFAEEFAIDGTWAVTAK